MRIIKFEKQYSDGHKIRFDIQAANVSYVYVDDKLHNPAQQFLESEGYKAYIDKLFIDIFNGNPLEWEQREITYRNYDDNSDIYYGFVVKCIEYKGQEVKYECEYAGRKIFHEGIVMRMDWQKALFEEWKKMYLPKYAIDIVMCIDCTGSMAHIQNEIKKYISNLYQNLQERISSKHEINIKLRIKLIEFRDYNDDGVDGMKETNFFNIPDEENDFKSYINELIFNGGGTDIAENVLESLALAINSDWVLEGDYRRHIIVIITDAPAHPLDAKNTTNDYYPSGMPANFNELTDWWEGGKMDKEVQKLILYAPDAYPWSEMGLNWDNTVHHVIKTGYEAEYLDFDTILNTIVSLLST